ncbi:MAG: MCE family protein [Phycisphaerae bacterium]|nr:MCE family protein [Phycisphaerae bacterium]
MRNTFLRDLFTGAAALAGIAALAVMLFLFGEVQGRLKRTIDVTLRIESATGLSDASGVTVNGVRIGRVTATRAVFDDAGAFTGVDVRVELEGGMPIPEPSAVLIDRSLVGEGTLQLEVPVGRALAGRVLANGMRVPADDAAPPLRVETTLGRLADSVSGAVREPLGRFGSTAEKIEKLADTYTAVGEQINQMLSPDPSGGPGLRSIVTRADAVLASAQKWLAQDDLLGKARASLDRLEETLDKTRTLAESWTRTAETVDRQARELGAEARVAREQMSQTLGRVDTAAEELARIGAAVNAGEGSLGQLVKNPDLYRSAQDAAQRLDTALVELKLLIEKLKAEGVRIRL